MLPGGRGGEFIIVAAIALIVVGPKDLPKMLRALRTRAEFVQQQKPEQRMHAQ